MIAHDRAEAERDERTRQGEARLQAEIDREINGGTQARPQDPTAAPTAGPAARIGYTRLPPQPSIVGQQPASQRSQAKQATPPNTQAPEDGQERPDESRLPRVRDHQVQGADAKAERNEVDLRNAVSNPGPQGGSSGSETIEASPERDGAIHGTADEPPERDERGLVNRDLAWEDRDDAELEDKGFDLDVVDLVRDAKRTTPQTLQAFNRKLHAWVVQERARRKGDELTAYQHEMDQTVQNLRSLAYLAAKGEDSDRQLKFLRQSADGWSRALNLDTQDLLIGAGVSTLIGIFGSIRASRARKNVERFRALHDPGKSDELRQELFKGPGPDSLSDDLLRHTFLGGMPKPGTKVVGLHYEANLGNPPPYIVRKRGTPNQYGVYHAHVAIFDPRTGRMVPKEQRSTMFPRDMSPDQVADMIQEGRQHVPNRDRQFYTVPNGPKKGMKIEFRFDQNGKLLEGFPHY